MKQKYFIDSHKAVTFLAILGLMPGLSNGTTQPPGFTWPCTAHTGFYGRSKAAFSPTSNGKKTKVCFTACISGPD